MIDVHCHLIPEIDDGSCSLSETIKMAKAASSLGYSGIFATPHYIEGSHETSSKDIETSVAVLNKLLKEKNIDISVYVGNEIYFSGELVTLLKGECVCTLGNSKYVLIELPRSGTVLNLLDIVSHLSHIGYTPVIAHPERYEFVQKNIKSLLPIIEEGALLQINVASINGFYGNGVKKTVIKLLKYNMVHLMGTDSHNATSVYEVYETSMHKISKILSKEKLYQIQQENPDRILKDMVVEIQKPNIK